MTSDQTPNTGFIAPQQKPWLFPVALMTGIFFLNFMARVVLAPLLVTVEQDLGITHGQAGGLFMFISLGYGVGLLISGLISSRITHRRTIVVSSVIMGLALSLTAFSRGLTELRLGLLITGVGAGIYLPSAMPTITTIVAPLSWGKALAVHELAPNLSFLLAPLLVEVLAEAVSWRGAVAVVGLGGVAMGLVYAGLGRGGDFHGSVPNFAAVRSILRLSSFWILMVFFALAAGASLGLYSIIPLYLVAEGVMPTREAANVVLAASRASGLVMVFSSGWLTARYGEKKTMAWLLLTTGVATVGLGLARGNPAVVMVFAQAFFAVAFFPAALAAISRIAPARLRNVVFSLIAPVVVFVGAGLIPAWIGYLGELDRFRTGFVVFGVIISISIVFIPALKFPKYED